MAIHEVEFKSFNEIETVKGWIYTPIREPIAVSYTHLRAHETDSYLVCRLLLEKKKKQEQNK